MKEERKKTSSASSLDMKFHLMIHNVLKAKWPDAPTNMAELEAFLRSKNIEVDAIGTSDAAVQAWLDTIVNCR